MRVPGGRGKAFDLQRAAGIQLVRELTCIAGLCAVSACVPVRLWVRVLWLFCVCGRQRGMVGNREPVYCSQMLEGM